MFQTQMNWPAIIDVFRSTRFMPRNLFEPDQKQIIVFLTKMATESRFLSCSSREVIQEIQGAN